MVFLPSMRYGSLSVLTSNQPSVSLRAATIFPQSLISPFTSVTFAPAAQHSIKFDCGTSRGIKICASIPAAAAYAASAPAALPAEGIATLVIPSSTHIETAHDNPRALNDPVGLMPSSFTHRSLAPSRAPRRLAWISGVMPSPRLTIAAGFETGSTGAYRHMLEGPLAIQSRFQLSRAFLRS